MITWTSKISLLVLKNISLVQYLKRNIVSPHGHIIYIRIQYYYISSKFLITLTVEDFR